MVYMSFAASVTNPSATGAVVGRTDILLTRLCQSRSLVRHRELVRLIKHLIKQDEQQATTGAVTNGMTGMNTHNVIGNRMTGPECSKIGTDRLRMTVLRGDTGNAHAMKSLGDAVNIEGARR